MKTPDRYASSTIEVFPTPVLLQEKENLRPFPVTMKYSHALRENQTITSVLLSTATPLRAIHRPANIFMHTLAMSGVVAHRWSATSSTALPSIVSSSDTRTAAMTTAEVLTATTVSAAARHMSTASSFMPIWSRDGVLEVPRGRQATITRRAVVVLALVSGTAIVVA
nr:hypothetical protein CFP56_59702 [Quercus suber]